MTAEKIQRWALYVSQFRYTIEYKRGCENQADYFSRVPSDPAPSKPQDTEIGYVFSVAEGILPVTAEKIAEATRKDPILMKVARYTHIGWPNELIAEEKTLKPFFARKDEIGLDRGCLMLGLRLIIPKELQARMLDEIHEGHLGVVKSKAVARSYVWWPGIDADIEYKCKTCEPCQQIKPNPPATKSHIWIPARQQWERIHVDYAGPLEGHMFLVVVDAYAKWPEIIFTKSTTSTTTCNALRGLFARYGLPSVLVSDNGTCFTSAEFKAFTEHCGILHKFSPPYHPATNGQAERFVRSFKDGLKKGQGELQLRLDKWLLAYRNAPHAITGVSPAIKFLGRNLRTRLDLVYPSTDKSEHTLTVESKAELFEVGDKVWVRDYLSADRWKKGSIKERTGPLTYIVSVAGRGEWKRHIDQLRSRCDNSDGETKENIPQQVSKPLQVALPTTHNSSSGVNLELTNSPRVGVPSESPESSATCSNNQGDCTVDDNSSTPISLVPPEALRRSSRNRRAPKRLNL